MIHFIVSYFIFAFSLSLSVSHACVLQTFFDLCMPLCVTCLCILHIDSRLHFQGSFGLTFVRRAAFERSVSATCAIEPRESCTRCQRHFSLADSWTILGIFCDTKDVRSRSCVRDVWGTDYVFFFLFFSFVAAETRSSRSIRKNLVDRLILYSLRRPPSATRRSVSLRFATTIVRRNERR